MVALLTGLGLRVGPGVEPELGTISMKVMPEASKRTWWLRAWATRGVGKGDIQVTRLGGPALREEGGPTDQEGMGAGRGKAALGRAAR